MTIEHSAKSTLETHDPVMRAVDGTGRPVAGALLRLVVAGGEEPVETFSDEACTVPHVQPLVADDGGFFPKLFVTDEVGTTPPDALIWVPGDRRPSRYDGFRRPRRRASAPAPRESERKAAQ